jgi:arginyl-tRNA synthetase
MNAEDDATKNARLKLVEATCQVLKNGLNLIGIEVVEKM